MEWVYQWNKIMESLLWDVRAWNLFVFFCLKVLSCLKHFSSILQNILLLPLPLLLVSEIFSCNGSTFCYQFSKLVEPRKGMEKAMAPHSSTLAWKIPWMEEPGGLQSMESLRVGHDWATSLALFTFMHWRRKWQPTPVFLPGESQGRGSLVGCRLWGCTESDTTEVTLQQQPHC